MGIVEPVQAIRLTSIFLIVHGIQKNGYRASAIAIVSMWASGCTLRQRPENSHPSSDWRDQSAPVYGTHTTVNDVTLTKSVF